MYIDGQGYTKTYLTIWSLLVLILVLIYNNTFTVLD